jgi:hypothetical protein
MRGRTSTSTSFRVLEPEHIPVGQLADDPCEEEAEGLEGRAERG